MPAEYDIAIVGSGFGGAMLAQVARRLGKSVVLLERGSHPRFAIGESTSPLMNLIIEQLAQRYDLPNLLPLTAWGAWQRTYPEIVGGLKRGFTYFKQEAGKPFEFRADRSNQLMVAASPNDEIADTHWLRADIDHFLVKEAIAAGTDYFDQTQLSNAEKTSEGHWKLSGERHGEPYEVSAAFLVDATGPRGFLSRAFNLPEATFDGYPKTHTLFSHFTGVKRCEEMPEFQTTEKPPFPMDDAALHHVFDGGWMWVLRFNNGVTSAGIAVTEALSKELNLAEGEPAWHRFLQRFPTIGAQFANAKPIVPFLFSPKLAYRCTVASGEDWAMLPSAAGFIDPLFSTGMPLTLLGVERLGRMIEEAWETPEWNSRLAEYGKIILAESDWTAHFIAGCYDAFPQFELFTALSMFYFAAASFSEMSRRLDKRHLVTRYLAMDRDHYNCGLRQSRQRISDLRGQATPEDLLSLNHQIASAIDPMNIAGLCAPEKSNWYNVDLNDLVINAEKLELSKDEMREVLRTAPWAQV